MLYTSEEEDVSSDRTPSISGIISDKGPTAPCCRGGLEAGGSS
jgi:hypothetical protein